MSQDVYLLLQRGGSRVFGHFTEAELYSKSPDIGNTHRLYGTIPVVLNWLREELSSPIVVESTVRTTLHNAAIGGATNSQHLEKKARAVDFKPTQVGAFGRLQQDLEQRGPIFQELVQMGVRGIGIYDRFFHLDFRVESAELIHEWNGTRYAFWDNRTKETDGVVTALTRPFTSIGGEDGVKDSHPLILAGVAAGVFLLLSVIVKALTNGK